jgi:hypothetical protein
MFVDKLINEQKLKAKVEDLYTVYQAEQEVKMLKEEVEHYKELYKKSMILNKRLLLDLQLNNIQLKLLDEILEGGQ